MARTKRTPIRSRNQDLSARRPEIKIADEDRHRCDAAEQYILNLCREAINVAMFRVSSSDDPSNVVVTRRDVEIAKRMLARL